MDGLKNLRGLTMADPETLNEIESVQQYKDFISLYGDQILVLNFYADWANPCKYMNNVFKELSIKFSNMKFANVSKIKYICKGLREK